MPLLPYHDNDPNHTLLGDTLEDDPHRIHPKEAISLFSEGDHENRGLDPLVQKGGPDLGGNMTMQT